MEYFNVWKSTEFLGEFIVCASAKLLLSLEEFSTSAEPIYNLFKYDLPDFYKYVISAYGAKVRVKTDFPYFIITFPYKHNAEEFAAELNKRYAEKNG